MYDVTIIGSGIGGLLCATFLAKEGMKVCVVEKNKQLGGNLQTFSRNKQLFDTGVHYIGGLEKGQTLHQIFKYAGLFNGLNLEKMNEAFDKILIEGDENIYHQAQGWKAFKEGLLKSFPDESEAIEAYHKKIKEVCAKFPLYHLTLEGDEAEKFSVMNESVKKIIESLTKNVKLQSVLVGNNLLYASVAGQTPFHVHALIVNSYIESSWKCVDGGSQIVKLLTSQLRKHDAEILRNAEVKKIVETDGTISHIILEDGKSIKAKNFIAAISPAETMKMLGSTLIKKNYRNRILGLSNTVSSFSLYIVLKEKTILYENCNYYYHRKNKIWSLGEYNFEEWPLGYGLYFTRDKKNPDYASSISVLTLMQFDDVKKWGKTFNTTKHGSSRGAEYDIYKEERSQKLLQVVFERFPQIKENIKAHYAATPLTNRDYIGMADGSIYGIQKDYNDPLKTIISPRTKISNLFLTGQNINLHGILGTSLTAILTCTMLLGENSLVDKIRNA